MKIDTRTFKFAGSSADANGVYKARFANTCNNRTKVMEKLFGYTNVVLVELPNPMTKLEAISWLLETKPEGVNLDSLTAKNTYINTQIAKINGTLPAKKRGRPKGSGRLHKNVVTIPENPVNEGIVNTIVKSIRNKSHNTKASGTAKVATS